MFHLWLLLPSLVVVCAYVWTWSIGRRARRLLAGLPTYPQLPFIGSVHLFYGGSEVVYSRLVEMSETIEEQSKPFLVWLGAAPILLVSDAEDVKAVTNNFIEKPHYYDFGRIWLGDGLVTAPGAIWKRSIKKLAGTFVGSIVEGYQGVFNSQARKLVQNFKTEAGREPFDAMHKYLAFTTLETICQTALGVPQISESIVTTKYYESFNRALEILIKRPFNLLYHSETIYRLTPSYVELSKCIEYIHNVSDTVIAKRYKEREEAKKLGIISTETEEKGRIRFKSFLEQLMDLHDIDPTFTKQQMKSEVDTIIVGGQETVASTLFYSLLMVGCNTHIQDKLYAEIKHIFGDSLRDVDKEDLGKLTYCEAVINETLRLFPPVPAVVRRADWDLKLKSCTIPAGTAVVVNSFGAGRSKRAWGEDALQYRPERWLDDREYQPASFLAFSYGKRACIGKRYAMALLKTVLVHCLRELAFSSEAHKIEWKVDIALKPARGHLMRVHLREKLHR